MLACEEEKNGLQDLVTGENLVLLASSVILALGFDLLIAQPFVAASYPVFILALLSVVYGNTRQLLVRGTTVGWFLVVPLVALALTRFFYANEVLRLINSLLVPVLFVAHVLLVTGNSRHEWFRSGFLKDIVRGLINRPLRHIAKTFFLALARRESDPAGRSVARKAILGIVFSLPVLIVVVMLLASADLVFDSLLRAVLDDITLGEVVRHAALVGLVTLLAFSFVWGLTNNRAAPLPCAAETKKLDAIVVISGLCVLSAVYLLFSVIQFSYLFGGAASHLPSGLSYADYARRGFFELVAVALINTVLVVGAINLAAPTGSRSAAALKGLNSVLVLSTFVMLLSAHYRMSLYEESYGYTYLRVFTHAFMAMVFVMLGATLYKIWSGRINLAKWYVMIGLIAYVLLNYANVDAFIAAKNMERYRRTGDIDVYYMAGLSPDAYPYLAELAHDPNPAVQRLAWGQINFIRYAKHAELFADRSWQGYNLSVRRARDTLWEFR